MKKTIKKLFIALIVLCFAIPQLSCNKSSQIITGSTTTQINDIFPKITGIASCYWEYETISKEKDLSVGPNNYKFYGFITLTKEYFLQILEQYVWKEYNENISVKYIENIKKTTSLKVCDEFADEISTAAYKIMVLDEKNEKLYFYVESN